MRDPWARADQLASIGSFALAAITFLAGTLAGQGWLIITSFVILLVAIGILFLIVRNNRKTLREQHRFLNGEGFTSFPLSEQEISLQPFSVMGAPNSSIILGGVPFKIETREHGALMAMVGPTLTNEARVLDLNTRCSKVDSIFFLVSAGWAVKSWQGAKPGEGWDEKVIGQIILTFRDGTKQEQELRLGHHLRDTSVGNQPWAVDQIRDKHTSQVWLSSDEQFALDMLRIKVKGGPNHLENIRIIAKLKVEVVPRIFMRASPAGDATESRLPEIKILGVTCWSAEEK